MRTAYISFLLLLIPGRFATAQDSPTTLDCTSLFSESDAQSLGGETIVEPFCESGIHEFNVMKGGFEGILVRIHLQPDTGVRYESALARAKELAPGVPSARMAGGTVTEETTYGEKGFVYVPKDSMTNVDLAFLKGKTLCSITVFIPFRNWMTPEKAERIARKAAALCAAKLP